MVILLLRIWVALILFPDKHKMFCKSYTDVVFSPVDGTDGHTQTTQAALVHGAGDGAAQARVAPQSKAAWGGGKL